MEKKDVATYTLRTVPRPVWEKFRAQLGRRGQSINWAFNQFVKQYGDGSLELTE